MINFARYRKAVVAAAGVIVMIAGVFGLDTAANADDQLVQAFDGVIGALTAFGVYRVPNA